MKGLARSAEPASLPVPGNGEGTNIALLSAAADLALILDDAGVIRDLHLNQIDHPLEEAREWRDKPWAETVSRESLDAIRELLREAAASGSSSRRQVSHLSAIGDDIPVAYTAVRLPGGHGLIIALGRDLRPVSTLQQGLVEAQQALQRDFARMRQLETRYQHLLQTSAEGVLLLDAGTQQVLEANPAAVELLGQPASRLVGQTFPFSFEPASETVIAGHLAAARVRGEAEPAVVRLENGGRELRLTASLLPHDVSARLVVRLLPLEGGHPRNAGRRPAPGDVVEALPDGVVLTDSGGRILAANRAFLDLVQVALEAQVRGEPLGRWLGRPGADLSALLSALRDHGLVRLFATALRGDLGSVSDVEIAGAAIGNGSGALTLAIRDVGRRLTTGPRGARDLTRAVEQLTTLLGRVSLRQLVRDTSALVERHFIEAALEATGDNRSAAAAVLGVSRQSLYVKLRRHREDLPGRGPAAPRGTVPKSRRRKQRP